MFHRLIRFVFIYHYIKEATYLPLLAFCPISPVVVEYNSMKETAPVVLSAELFTLASLGRRFSSVIPQPDYTPTFVVL